MQLTIIDLGIGNLRSVEQAFKTVAPNANITVSSKPADIANADRVVLPGQGAIGTWFSALRERNLESALKTAMDEKPLLGICVGMQACFDHSEEDGGVDGLGLFKGQVRHFKQFHNAEEHLKIPQMGWNQVAQLREHALWKGIDDQAYFYFVHSYCANSSPDANLGMVYGMADYGHQFIAAAGTGNVFAVQFHPEKSHDDGLQLLKNFTTWNGKPQ